MADSRWTRGRVAHVLGRMTRGAILSVGALTVAGLAGATFISKVGSRAHQNSRTDDTCVLISAHSCVLAASRKAKAETAQRYGTYDGL